MFTFFICIIVPWMILSTIFTNMGINQIFSWFLGLVAPAAIIYLLVMCADKDESKEEKERKEALKANRLGNNLPTKQTGVSRASSNGEETTLQKLRELKTLLDENLITQEEYDKKKTEILSRM